MKREIHLKLGICVTCDDKGKLRAFRNGDLWRDESLIGDELARTMFEEIESLTTEVKRLLATTRRLIDQGCEDDRRASDYGVRPWHVD